jgi:hypothetical protein
MLVKAVKDYVNSRIEFLRCVFLDGRHQFILRTLPAGFL